MRTIALITDYGARDHYAGVLKGVIASIAPDARVVDIAHEIGPQNVAGGAFVLAQSWSWFPPGTIFLTVVDPGVGTSRRVLVGKYADRYVVAPDNGLITWLPHEFGSQALHAAQEARYFLPQICTTFHGRDIMAPVAAHLARGAEPTDLGPAISDPLLLSIPFRAQAIRGGLRGQIIYVDRFGNLVTNIHCDQLSKNRPSRVTIGHKFDLGHLRHAFVEVQAGEPLAYIGSSSFVEIAINSGSAAELFGVATDVTVQFR